MISLEIVVGIKNFESLFLVMLTDNESKFSSPLGIEFHKNSNEERIKILYCEPGRADQKRACK